MNLFAGDRMFGGRVQGALGAIARPWEALPAKSMGQAGMTVRDVVARINHDVGVLGEYYNRNAELPLDCNVRGAEYQPISDNSDQIWKDVVVPFNQNPGLPAWNQPASGDVLARVAQNEGLIKAYGDKVAAAELKCAAKTGETPAAPGTPAGSGETRPPMPMTVSMIALGLMATAAIVGAIVLSGSE